MQEVFHDCRHCVYEYADGPIIPAMFVPSAAGVIEERIRQVACNHFRTQDIIMARLRLYLLDLFDIREQDWRLPHTPGLVVFAVPRHVYNVPHGLHLRLQHTIQMSLVAAGRLVCGGEPNFANRSRSA